MSYFMYPSNLIIKTKVDAKRFIKDTSGVFHWTAGYMDYLLEDGEVSYRSVADRGDVFAPYIVLEENEALLHVWNTRKQINDILKR